MGLKTPKKLDVLRNSPQDIFFGNKLWQREKDSNPHKMSQSHLCYHYTIPLFIKINCRRKSYYTILSGIVKQFIYKKTQICALKQGADYFNWQKV